MVVGTRTAMPQSHSVHNPHAHCDVIHVHTKPVEAVVSAAVEG